MGITELQARLYVLVSTTGRMDCPRMARSLDVDTGQAQKAADDLVALGAFIEYDRRVYEAMHPRFTAVNMYRRMCQRRNIKFGRNREVDGIGASLEPAYEAAKAK